MEAGHVWHIDYMQLNLNMALKLIRVLRRFYISSGFLGIRASPFCIKLCGIFHFYLNFNRIFFMQTVHTLIKCNFIE